MLRVGGRRRTIFLLWLAKGRVGQDPGLQSTASVSYRRNSDSQEVPMVALSAITLARTYSTWSWSSVVTPCDPWYLCSVQLGQPLGHTQWMIEGNERCFQKRGSLQKETDTEDLVTLSLFEVSWGNHQGEKSEKSGHLYNHSQSSRQKKEKLLKHCGTQRLPSAPSAPDFVFYCRVSVAMAVEPGGCV